MGCTEFKFITLNRFSDSSSMWGTFKSSLRILQQRVSLSKLVLCMISCNYEVRSWTVGCYNVNRLSPGWYATLYAIETRLTLLNIWLDMRSG